MKKLFLTLAFLIISHAASASSCPNLYPNNFQLSGSSLELCNSFFVTRFDTVHNVPLFSSELLNPSQPSVERSNDFHPDTRLDKNVRAENSDYETTGYDKGHLVPAEDASTPQEMHDTFLLSNMTPQEPRLNRIAWRMLEETVHKQVTASGRATIIITGAIYGKGVVHYIGYHQIQVPVAYYKIVYLDKNIECFYAINDNTAPRVQQVAISDLQQYVPFTIQ